MKKTAPRLSLKEANDKKHLLAFNRSCNKRGCVPTNCTHPSNVCALSEDEAKRSLIPPHITEKYKDVALGNLTHKVPKGKKGLVLDKIVDYKMNKKEQNLVIESNTPKINLSDVVRSSVATPLICRNRNITMQ